MSLAVLGHMRAIQAAGAVALTLAQWLQPTPPIPKGQPANQPPVPPGAVHKPAATVQMTNEIQFSPARVTIGPGAYVLWRNDSRLEHTVTDQPGAVPGVEMSVPAGSQPFDSGPIPPGYAYEHRFDAAGTYRYGCRYDGAAGMTGIIEVRPPPAEDARPGLDRR